ncbi:uncharacterized protein EV154DRAFT_554776 [Mucor mucedo]|uniref:uncharacterized protein n=1 Tax=Mucor mucedo TaxID=29922 RepID=UPI00221FF2C6|nr:uncharacterized protein EV154DRAFT_554776 [Mucor mucedo]KAI7885452.1 hypothetical protein EV154DRAFT_554776 [Mucor mucedo]
MSNKDNKIKKKQTEKSERKLVKRKMYWVMALVNVNGEKRRYAFTTDEDVSYKLLWEKITLILGADVREITYSRGHNCSHVLINSDESLSLALEYMEEKRFNYKFGIEICVDYFNNCSKMKNNK